MQEILSSIKKESGALMLLISFMFVSSIRLGFNISLGMIAAGFLLAVVGATLIRFQGESGSKLMILPAVAATVLAVFMSVNLSLYPGFFIKESSLKIFAWIYALTFLAVPVYLFQFCIPQGLRRAVFWIGFSLLAFLYFSMIAASPRPVIDVYLMEQESAQHLVNGISPFSAGFDNPYSEKELKIYGEMKYYSYPPSNLYLQTLGYLIGGDVRFAHAASIALSALFIWMILRRRNEVMAELLAIVFLAQPTGPVVLEMGWTDPLIVCGLGMFLLLFYSGRSDLAGIVFGYTVSLKHYAILTAVSALSLNRNLRFWALAIFTALLTTVPFLVWDPASLIDNGFLYQLGTPRRADSLSITSFLHNFYGIEIPGKWLSVSIAVTASLILVPIPGRGRDKLPGFLLGAMLITFSTFFLGSQAFTNY